MKLVFLLFAVLGLATAISLVPIDRDAGLTLLNLDRTVPMEDKHVHSCWILPTATNHVLVMVIQTEDDLVKRATDECMLYRRPGSSKITMVYCNSNYQPTQSYIEQLLQAGEYWGEPCPGDQQHEITGSKSNRGRVCVPHVNEIVRDWLSSKN